jgi:hypothetical protein
MIALAGLALLAVGVLIGLVLMDAPPPPETPPPDLPVAAPDPEPSPLPPIRPAPTRPRRATGGKVGRSGSAGADADQPLDAEAVQRFGQAFEKKWLADRERLGAERHREMERLWFEGRRPRGDPEAVAKLERLLEEFPDTNRAGCAAMELGHHAIRSRTLDLEARRERAQRYWHLVEQRYDDTLCEYNAPAAGMSKLALATWVYRHTDPAMARRLLEEVVRQHQGETDHLGRPLEVSAKRVLGLLK